MVQIFNYNDNPVSFYDKNGMLYLNATGMAKQFDKQTSDWLRQKSTHEFLSALSGVRGIPRTELSIVSKGGLPENQGTWFHEDVAIEFARWLSPTFAIWCNDRIKDLLKHGVTSIENLTPKEVAQRLLDAEIDRERLQVENRLQAKELKESAPKVEYYKNVIQSDQAIRTTIIAKDLGMSATRLNIILHEMKVQYMVNDTWILYAAYQERGYTVSVTHPYTGSDGAAKTRIYTCWTQKGREFIMKAVPKYLEAIKSIPKLN